jgi:MoCo/4Fe-4S cofactor protein with predicted Tat translocation signal
MSSLSGTERRAGKGPLGCSRRRGPGGPAPCLPYWRSRDELADAPEFRAWLAAEFPGIASAMLSAPSRRQFLKLMGASMALAGLSGCRWPSETIAPYAKRPEGRTPGVPVRYATAMELGGVATGLLVTSYDGRPIKIEGNDQHPFSRGKTNAWMQASVLELYDPDRSTQVLRRTEGGDGAALQPSSWEEFEAFARQHFAALRANQGEGLCVLCEASCSPSLAATKARIQQAYPNYAWLDFAALPRVNEVTGSAMAFGQPFRPQLDLAQADVIVSLDSDFLMMHPAAVRYAGDFAARRQPEDGAMNRLYMVESNLTVTGAAADRRYAVRSSEVGIVAGLLAQALLTAGLPWPDNAADIKQAVAKFAAPDLDAGFIQGLAADLLAHRGRSVILAGSSQPAAVHLLAHVLNEALGNVGTTVRYTEEPLSDHVAWTEVLKGLATKGPIETLLVLGGNPVRLAAHGDAIEKLIASASTSVYLGLYADETAQRCTWHLPQAHYLESWGDGRANDGTVSVVQPLIEPLYDGRTAVEILALLVGDENPRAYDIVRRTFQEQFGGGDNWEAAWQRALHDGLVANSAWAMQDPKIIQSVPRDRGPKRDDFVRLLAEQWEPPDTGYELSFVPDYSVYDGRFANNAWLQEMPDPITRLTWDNAALISPADAKKLGVEKYGDVLRIEVGDGGIPAPQMLEMPAYVLPGHAEGSITLSLGYGRGRLAGRVAEGTGFDVNRLRPAASPWIVSGAKVTATGGHYPLATTQDHHAIRSKVGDQARAERVDVLVREATVAHYRAHPDFAKHAVHHLPLLSLWQEHKYDAGHRWAMAIDLNKCIGCGACIVACQAENNVPVVGKDEVRRGREMHWLRVDRYFKGEPQSPQVVHQPVACHHCENAPCEQVCPVAATVHSSEGLNDMVYNRCIGTRYCSNNCPYKVRRFNWFNNWPLTGRTSVSGWKALSKTEQMVFNPEVTVRSRGVMEKCTYCVQRISAAKIAARNEGRAIADGEITPACAQACPTGAIVFGDLNDPNSRVTELHKSDRAYAMLAELNIKPRTLYLAKLRNPPDGLAADATRTEH